MAILTLGIIGAIALIGIIGIKTIDQTERGLVETFGKYTRYAEPGMTWLMPGIQTIRKVDITENMAEAEPQEIITDDNLNTEFDTYVWFKVKDDEKSVKASQYNVSNYHDQIINTVRAALRDICGNLKLKECISGREKINKQLLTMLTQKTSNWGIEVIRSEIKDIKPPKDVQDAMNAVVKSENQKISAVNLALAAQNEADGFRMAAIKKAEGEKQAKILEAQGEAQYVEITAKAQAEAIKQVNVAAKKYFTGNAQKLKQLEVTQASLEKNSKIILTEKGIKPTILLGSGKLEM